MTPKRKDTKDYWAKLLTRHGLSMERGRSRRLVYVGDSAAIESIDGDGHAADKGKVHPKLTDG
jgi:hypothetical protein